MFKKKPKIDYEGVYLEIIAKKDCDKNDKTEFDVKAEIQVNNIAPHIVFALVLAELKDMCQKKKLNFYEHLAFNEAVDIRKFIKEMQKTLNKLEKEEQKEKKNAR